MDQNYHELLMGNSFASLKYAKIFLYREQCGLINANGIYVGIAQEKITNYNDCISNFSLVLQPL